MPIKSSTAYQIKGAADNKAQIKIIIKIDFDTYRNQEYLRR